MYLGRELFKLLFSHIVKLRIASDAKYIWILLSFAFKRFIIKVECNSLLLLRKMLRLEAIYLNFQFSLCIYRGQ